MKKKNTPALGKKGDRIQIEVELAYKWRSDGHHNPDFKPDVDKAFGYIVKPKDHECTIMIHLDEWLTWPMFYTIEGTITVVRKYDTSEIYGYHHYYLADVKIISEREDT